MKPPYPENWKNKHLTQAFLADTVAGELESPRRALASQPAAAHGLVHSFSKERTSALLLKGQ